MKYFLNYVYLARPDHWFKNIFMIPGIALAYLWESPPLEAIILKVALAFISLCLLVSANYVINEYILTYPLFALLFTWYLKLASQENSIAQLLLEYPLAKI